MLRQSTLVMTFLRRTIATLRTLRRKPRKATAMSPTPAAPALLPPPALTLDPRLRVMTVRRTEKLLPQRRPLLPRSINGKRNHPVQDQLRSLGPRLVPHLPNSLHHLPSGNRQTVRWRTMKRRQPVVTTTTTTTKSRMRIMAVTTMKTVTDRQRSAGPAAPASATTATRRRTSRSTARWWPSSQASRMLGIYPC